MGKTFVRAKPARICDRKKSYNTYDQAVTMALIRTGSDKEPPPFLTAYRCQYCGRYHLSSQESKSGRFPAITATAAIA